MLTDEEYMYEALQLAKRAAAEDEVPVGAVLVFRGEVIGRAYNRKHNNRCATHHAEILAIEQACRAAGGWRLPGAVLYVTLEPCPMCAGAIAEARIERVVYGASDPQRGALGGAFNLAEMKGFYHPSITCGVLGDECKQLLSAYFKTKRAK